MQPLVTGLMVQVVRSVGRNGDEDNILFRKGRDLPFWNIVRSSILIYKGLPMDKKTINAKEILADIKAGMNHSASMETYQPQEEVYKDFLRSLRMLEC